LDSLAPLRRLNDGKRSHPPIQAFSRFGELAVRTKPVEHLINNAQSYFRKPYSEAYASIESARHLQLLESIFKAADDDNSGRVSLPEFRHCLAKAECRKVFSDFGIQPWQAEEVYRYLDRDRTGDLTIVEFMTSFEELLRWGHEQTKGERQFEIDMKKLRMESYRVKLAAQQEKQEQKAAALRRHASAPNLRGAAKPAYLKNVPPGLAPREPRTVVFSGMRFAQPWVAPALHGAASQGGGSHDRSRDRSHDRSYEVSMESKSIDRGDLSSP
jgi:hypothetical protein